MEKGGKYVLAPTQELLSINNHKKYKKVDKLSYKVDFQSN